MMGEAAGATRAMKCPAPSPAPVASTPFTAARPRGTPSARCVVISHRHWIHTLCVETTDGLLGRPELASGSPGSRSAPHIAAAIRPILRHSECAFRPRWRRQPPSFNVQQGPDSCRFLGVPPVDREEVRAQDQGTTGNDPRRS
jgi:hypothetical protein